MINVNSLNSGNQVFSQAAGAMGTGQMSDSVTRELQKQIADAQKQLQEISANGELGLEEKMKKRQEIQQKLNDLNNQLRQHQIELRKEATEMSGSRTNGTGNLDRTENASQSQNQNGIGNGKNSDKNRQTGFSTDSMQVMISAEGAMKQAQVQGSAAAAMEGRAGVLESEIKLDAGRGGNTERKEAELAQTRQRAQAAASAQMDTLAKAGEVMAEAGETDRGHRMEQAGEADRGHRMEQARKAEQESGKETEEIKGEKESETEKESGTAKEPGTVKKATMEDEEQEATGWGEQSAAAGNERNAGRMRYQPIDIRL